MEWESHEFLKVIAFYSWFDPIAWPLLGDAVLIIWRFVNENDNTSGCVMCVVSNGIKISNALVFRLFRCSYSLKHLLTINLLDLKKIYTIHKFQADSKTHVHSLWHGIIRLALSLMRLFCSESRSIRHFDLSVFSLKIVSHLSQRNEYRFYENNVHEHDSTIQNVNLERMAAIQSACESRVDGFNPTPV